MATEENNQNAEEIQENEVLNEKQEEQPAPDGQPEEPLPEEPAVCACTKCRCSVGKVFFFFLVVVLIALFGIPKTRQEILTRLEDVRAAVTQKADTARTIETIAADEAVLPEPAPAAEEAAPEEITVRLEQLENARDFENAEVVVATVEPVSAPPPAVAAETLKNLEDQQKALLAEIGRLRDQMRRQQDDFAGQISALRSSQPKPGLLEERMLMLNAREDAFEQQLVEAGVKIGRLEKNKADASAVLSLMTRMELTEQKMKISSVEKDRAIALLLAVYQMREASMSGQNFLMEQQSALALASSNPRLAGYIRSLTVAADQGVWTKTALQQSFNGYADRAVLSEEMSPKTDWFHQALNTLKRLVVIRRIDAPAEDASTQAVLARAQTAVNDGDIAIALVYLKELKGTAADEMNEWVRAAGRYVSTRKTISETVAAALGVVYAEHLKGE